MWGSPIGSWRWRCCQQQGPGYAVAAAAHNPRRSPPLAKDAAAAGGGRTPYALLRWPRVLFAACLLILAVGSSKAGTAVVYDDEQLLAAFRNASVDTILLAKDIHMNRDRWPTNTVTLDRKLEIRPLYPERLVWDSGQVLRGAVRCIVHTCDMTIRGTNLVFTNNQVELLPDVDQSQLPSWLIISQNGSMLATEYSVELSHENAWFSPLSSSNAYSDNTAEVLGKPIIRCISPTELVLYSWLLSNTMRNRLARPNSTIEYTGMLSQSNIRMGIVNATWQPAHGTAEDFCQRMEAVCSKFGAGLPGGCGERTSAGGGDGGGGSSDDTALIVGLAVGLGVGVPLLAVAAFFGLRAHRRRRYTDSSLGVVDPEVAGGDSGGQVSIGVNNSSGTPRAGRNGSSSFTTQTLMSGGAAHNESESDGGANVAPLSGGNPLGLKLLELLGKGAYGAVYRGTYQGSLVAVKVIQQRADVLAAASSARDLTADRKEGGQQQQDDDGLPKANGSAVRGTKGSKNTSAGTAACSARDAHRMLEATEAVLGSRFNHPHVMKTISHALVMPPAHPAAGAHAPSGQMHQNIAEVHIVMELCEGGTLKDWLDRRAMDLAAGAISQEEHLKEANRFIMEIAEGLAYLHAEGVVHGDMKCHNVLLATVPEPPPLGQSSAVARPGAPQIAAVPVRRQGEGADGCGDESPCANGIGNGTAAEAASSPPLFYVTKLADFGYSTQLKANRSHTTLSKPGGTISHIAPELLSTNRLGPTADVYAFGVMLWEIATSGTPFASMTVPQIIYAKTLGQVDSLLEFPAAVPPGMVSLARMCWHGQQEKRPDMATVCIELRRILSRAAGEPPE